MNQMKQVVLFQLFSLSFGYGTIPIKYKGSLMTLADYEKLDLCENKWCLADANRILQDMSYNNSVSACEDFDEFACGTFKNERAFNERYENVGFIRDYELKIDEERHKALKAPITDTDCKAVKVTKNFYQRCIASSE